MPARKSGDPTRQDGKDCVVDLPSKNPEYGWFDPHRGLGLSGLLMTGTIEGKAQTKLTAPDARDWVLLIGSKGKLQPKGVSLAPESFELFSIFDFKQTTDNGYFPGYVDKGSAGPEIAFENESVLECSFGVHYP